MRRTLVVTALAGCMLVLLPGAALAHASFDLRQVPADSTQDVVLRVPLERDAANDLVEVLVPATFTVPSCAGAPGWSCEQATTADGETVLTITRGPDGAGDVERFALSLATPAVAGVYAFPAIQTYDDGVEAAWIGEPGSDQPAPRLQVGDETAPVESNGAATPHTPLASEDPATPSSAPSPADEPAETPAPVVDDADATAADDAAADDDGGRPSTVLIVVGILLAVGALAGAVARLRSVTS